MKNARLNTMNPLVRGLAKATNATLTENGALTNKSTLSNVLDWFAAGGALRERQESEIVNLFQKAYGTDALMALKVLFYFRDIRGGQGERRTFRTCLNWLAKNHKDVVLNNLENVPFFGRWDDLYVLDGTPLEAAALDLIKRQLLTDMEAMREGESVTLLAKWMKSENTSSKESVRLARKTRESLGWSPRQYRKNLSALRAYIDVVEVKMCSKEFTAIDFQKVPSKALMNYKKAFKKHDLSRWGEYLSKVEKGEAKIHAKALFPYELLKAVWAEQDEMSIKALDLQWKNQVDYLKDNPHKGLVLADCSGSMTSNEMLPLAVAVSLAIYFAERNTGAFKDTFMTFSSQCQLQRLCGSNLKERAHNLTREGWCGSTNLQSAFEAILTAAVQNRVEEKDMPSVLYIVSDMEFNVACGTYDGRRGSYSATTNFDAAKQKYAAAGYKFPRIVFWNVNARNDQFPITEDENGVCLVSGASPSILKSVLSGKEFNPMAILEETIGNERYDRVTL
jgi:hypothetical protein